MTKPQRPIVGALVGALLALGVCASPATAQQTLGDALAFLLTNQLIPTDDFVKDAEATRATRDTITRLLLVELATLPISSSSAAFTYRLDPALGTIVRSSDSFGPFFTERSLTAGRGQLSLGMSVQTARFRSLDGQDLRDGRLVTTANQFRDEPQPFDVETLKLDIESRTVTVFASVGITDRLDVGVAAPFVHLSLEGERINTYRGAELLQASAIAEASGLADVAVRARYRLAGAQRGGVALVGEARLPTGREEDLLGGGEPSVRGVLIGSLEARRVGVYGNLGVTAGGVVDEIQYRGALTFTPTARLTVVGELVGRRIEGVGGIERIRAPHPSYDGVDTIRLLAGTGGTTTTSIVAGAKWNIVGPWLVSANLTNPLTSNGLRSGPVLLLGLDYAIGR